MGKTPLKAQCLKVQSRNGDGVRTYGELLYKRAQTKRVLGYALAAVVVTGAHDMVPEHALWSETASAWLRELVGRQVPTLGICYGHQLLAHALGGEVGYHPRGSEVGTVSVTLLPAGQCGLAEFDTALSELSELVPPEKGRLLHACGVAVSADREVTVMEAELLRATADSLGCPMPPLLPGQPLI